MHFIQRYRFLFRLIVLILSVSCMAVLLYNVMLLNRSHDYMEKKNRENYRQSAYAFANYLDEQFLKMYSLARHMCYDAEVSADLDAHVYNQVACIRSMKSYLNSAPLANEVGFYFFDTDYVITSQGKYTLDFFINGHIAKGNEALQERAAEFVKSNSSENWSFFSTFACEGIATPRLLMRVPIVVSGENGVHHGNALYCITKDSINSMFISDLRKDMRYVIRDANQTTLYQSDDVSQDVRAWNGQDGFDSLDYAIDRVRYTAFSVQKQLSYYAIVPENEMNQNLNEYYSTMSRIAWVCALCVLLTSVLAIVGSYMPIYTKINSIATRHGERKEPVSELDVLDSVITSMEQKNLQMESLMREKSDLLDTVILETILRHHEVSAQQEEWFKQRVKAQRFGVLVIEELRLGMTAQEALQEKMREATGVQLMIVGIPQEQHTALLCMMDEGVSLRRMAQTVYTALNMPGTAMGVSMEGADLKDLHAMYMCALTAMRQGSGLVFYQDIIQPAGGILEYPMEDTLMMIRFIEDGDEASARKALGVLREYLLRQSYPQERADYLRHELVSVLLKNLGRLNVEVEQDTVRSLIAAPDADTLCGRIQDMLGGLCETIRTLQQDKNRDFNQKILMYVSDHFTSPEISLKQLSDVFGLSIYSLSKLYKEIAGIGFREHIVALRMELARSLVVTTNKSLRAIAEETGIENPDYLTKLFKMHYGVTPSQMRQEILSVQEAARGEDRKGLR